MTSLVTRDLIAIGASAGGLLAMREILLGVPVDLPAAIFVVIHRHPTAPSYLAEVLGRGASLPVREPEDGEAIERGRIYLAPRDLHMTVEGPRMRVDRGPKQHHTRPAIDPLFRSLAQHHGPRVAGVLLSGSLSDGVAGLVAIKDRRGISVVQDPVEAEYPSMPRSALLYDHVDLVFRLRSGPELLSRLARGAPVPWSQDADVWRNKMGRRVDA